MAVVNVGGIDYHIDNKLKTRWDKINNGQLAKEDDDKVFIVDGRERSGKSVFCIQQACYIDPTLVGCLSRICFTAEEFVKAIRETRSNDNETKCIVFDEAFRGLASRSTMSKTNKKIVQALMEVGQKNLVLWIVLPSFFMLDLYPAMLRSEALFHIKKDKQTKRRSFSVYSRKKKGKLYQIGIKKGWTYAIPTRFNGRFSKKFPGGDKFKNMYLKKKMKSLEDSEQDMNKVEYESRYQQQRDILIYMLLEREKLSLEKGARVLKEYGIDITKQNVFHIKKKVAEKGIQTVKEKRDRWKIAEDDSEMDGNSLESA